MQQRLTYIDIAKALGLCLVILSHTVYPQLMFFALGCFVPIFFVTSGYTTQSVNIAKKCKRLLIPYFLFSSTFLILYAAQQWFTTHSLKEVTTAAWGILYSRYCVYPLEQTNNIVMLPAGNAPLWFLTSMFTAYVALIPLLRWPKLRGGVIIGYITLTWCLNRLPILLPWSVDCALLMAVFIFSGMQLRESKLLNNNSLLTWSVIMLGYCITTAINGYENISVRDFGHSVLLCIISGVLGSILILKLSTWIAQYKIGKWFAAIGRYSLTIFCVQMPLLVATRIICSKAAVYFSLNIPSEVIALCQLVSTLCVGYAIAVVAHKVLPKIL